jgi:nicotinamide-nucleotide amidase
MSSAQKIVEFIAIGREILDGRVIDTNSVWLAQRLKNLGLVLRHAQKVDDEISRIIEAFEIASRRSEIIFVSGGLGPTSDDLTSEAFAKFQHSEPVLNAEAEIMVRAWLEKRKRPVNEAQLKQAVLPVGVEVIANNFGTAPAFTFKERTRQWFFLPGVPRELQGIYEEKIQSQMPRNDDYRHYHWVTQFTAESALQMDLKELISKLPKDFELAFRTKFPENYISLFGNLDSPEKIQSFESLKKEITEILAPSTYTHGENPSELPELFFEKLKSKNIILAFVESCTGGLNSSRISDISGASEVLMGSWVTYDNAMKLSLGVSAEILKSHGAVSEECAREMALKGYEKLKVQFPESSILVISTTGIAGPNGGTSEKPVGLCHVGLAFGRKQSSVIVETHKVQTPVTFERLQNKLYFSQKSLTLALKLIDA